MRRRYNLLSFAFGLPGLVCFFGYGVLIRVIEESRKLGGGPSNTATLAGMIFCGILGVVLWGTGFCFFAKYKGRSPVWGLAIFLSCVGLLVLLFLKDRNAERLAHLKAMLTVLGRPV